ncbi:hypothetical protein [Amycolatopsis benzoatilytica]|uniref:hypothetical protein n=1 Tax=Amycolatopsis benzoatilytica TaxID=346045 RepID=UPI00035EC555|nr:hypothetical protein [Amycolatopsis benzoatilytica]
MTSFDFITLDVPDVAAAERFYLSAFDLGDRLRFRQSDAPTSGFRGYTLSLTVAQPANAVAYLDAALAAGGTSLKPAAKSFWGFGGVVRAPDGAIWKVACSSKKDTGAGVREYEQMVLLLGASDVAASKEFYVSHRLEVGKSFGKKYVEFETSPIKLALYGRRALAKDAGVPMEGSGSHRLTIGGDAGPMTDPDGFAWETSVLAG